MGVEELLLLNPLLCLLDTRLDSEDVLQVLDGSRILRVLCVFIAHLLQDIVDLRHALQELVDF